MNAIRFAHGNDREAIGIHYYYLLLHVMNHVQFKTKGSKTLSLHKKTKTLKTEREREFLVSQVKNIG